MSDHENCAWSVAVYQRIKPGSIELANGLNNLAELYRVEKRPGDAEPLFKQAIFIYENVAGVDSSLVSHAKYQLRCL